MRFNETIKFIVNACRSIRSTQDFCVEERKNERRRKGAQENGVFKIKLNVRTEGMHATKNNNHQHKSREFEFAVGLHIVYDSWRRARHE